MLNGILVVAKSLFNSKTTSKMTSSLLNRVNNKYTSYSLIPLFCVMGLSYFGINEEGLYDLILRGDLKLPGIPNWFTYGFLVFITYTLVVCFIYLLFKKDGFYTSYNNTKVETQEFKNKLNTLKREDEIQRLKYLIEKKQLKQQLMDLAKK